MACQKCGNCCSGGEGYIVVTNATYRKHTKFRDYPHDFGLFYRVITITGACPYLTKDNLCEIYNQGRPLQCRVGRCLKSLVLPAPVDKKNSASLEVRIEALA
jgi:Fe-S-cluster containining protein